MKFAHPTPRSPWIMSQTWRDLLFMHWPMPRAMLEALLPEGLEVDTFEEQGWIGIVPFRCTGMRPHFLPSPLGLLNFPAVAVRICVTCEGKPGLYFLSLDASHRVANWVANRVMRLPFFFAPIHRSEHEGWQEWHSRRAQRWGPAATLRMRYRPEGEMHTPEPDSLEHWLLDRRFIYTLNRRWRLMRSAIGHAPWKIQSAEIDIQTNTMAQGHGLPLPEEPPHLMFAKKMKVALWAPKRVDRRR